MTQQAQTFEDAWLDGEAPATPEHDKKKRASDDALKAEAAEFSDSWKELEDK
jgi:hypothetical protein